MWLIIFLFGVFWIADWRLKQYSWEHALSTLAFALVVLVSLAMYAPGWAWKTALMVYMMFPYWATLFSVRYPLSSAEPGVREFDPQRDEMWPELPGMLDAAGAGLAAEGLTRIASFTEQLPGHTVLLTLVYESPDQTEAVSVTGATSLVMPGTESERRLTQVESVAAMAFEDGRRLAITNASAPTAAGPETTMEFLPGVADPAHLLRIARAYRARRFTGVRLAPVRGGVPPLEYLTGRQRLHVERQAASPFYRRGADGALYPTLRGVLVLGWGLLFPFRQVGILRGRARERRLLRELGMDAGTAPVPRPRTRNPFDLHLAAAWVFAILLILLD